MRQIYHTTGENLFKVPDENACLIDGVLWEGDVTMLLGSEKAGKSILALQMAASLTSGESFLDKYVVLNKVPILYVQTEGKNQDISDRLICMKNAVEIDASNFHHLYHKFLPFDVDMTLQVVNSILAKIENKPRVIYLDSLYTSMEGDLIDNKSIRRFISKITPFLEENHLTLVIIHHDNKEWFVDGKQVDRGDKGSYGSVFLRAWVDHILYLKKNKDNTRTLSCETQRSGRVLEKEELLLIEPDPLCFQIKGSMTPSIEIVRAIIFKSHGISREDIMEKSKLSSTMVGKAVSSMLSMKIVCKTKSRPVLYSPGLGNTS